jgi:hypothetical protein
LVLVAALPNHAEVIWKLRKAEALARECNLPTGVLMELSDLRETLDDL